MFFVFSMNGIIAVCSNAAALSKAPDKITGAAAALIGALQYGGNGIPLGTRWGIKEFSFNNKN